jgi:hypothetical protein
MKRMTLQATLSAIVVSLLTVPASAQPRDNFIPEADRQRANFQRSASTEFLVRQGIERQSGVTGGFGTAVRAPSALSTSPRQRSAATFGAGTVGSIGGPASKPFANVRHSPTVSPYMNLFRNDLSGADDLNYQTLVQPQLRQQEFNRQFDIQEQQINRRLNALAARNAFSPQGSANMMPTGHAATHRYYSHFFPALQRR